MEDAELKEMLHLRDPPHIGETWGGRASLNLSPHSPFPSPRALPALCPADLRHLSVCPSVSLPVRQVLTLGGAGLSLQVLWSLLGSFHLPGSWGAKQPVPTTAALGSLSRDQAKRPHPWFTPLSQRGPGN